MDESLVIIRTVTSPSRDRRVGPLRWHSGVLALLLGTVGVGCAGHSAHTAEARTALDAGNAEKALESYNRELKVKSGEDLPEKMSGKNALYVLDRSMIQQQLQNFELSSRDLELADKQVEMLDLKRSTVDDVGKYMFSDDTGPYKAPPYEKLLINTVNMVNYLERHQLSGAKVEARRFSILQDYLERSEYVAPSMAAPGAYLAGFVFEKAGDPNLALRYYDEALSYGDFASLLEPVRRLTAGTTPRGENIPAFLEKFGATPTAPTGAEPATASPSTGAAGGDAAGAAASSADQPAELLIVISYGRVPAKIARRIPIGLALTWGALYLSPAVNTMAGELAAQGLVTWINYPELEETKRTYVTPSAKVDGAYVTLEAALYVEKEARAAYEKQKGQMMAAAITRTVTRFAAGQGARAAAQAATNDSTVGMLFSLGTQAALAAADTPDTRSWSTLPGRIAVSRIVLPPGEHKIEVAAQGMKREATIKLAPGGWEVVTMTVLR